jgi:prepilin-type N-terminal cleavage/methylation domain-containing protein
LGPRKNRRGVSLVEVVVVAVVLGVLTVILLPCYLEQVDKARGAATKSGVRSIQIAVLAYSLDHLDTYPAASDVNSQGLKGYADVWPANPWTGKPMADAGHYLKGDFRYEAWSGDPQNGSLASTGAPTIPGTDHFGLIGYLADPGYPFVARPLSHSAATAGSADSLH